MTDTSDFYVRRIISTSLIIMLIISDKLFETFIREKSPRGNTALCFACQHSSKEKVNWMIEEVKCDIYETGYYGRNCFLAAVATEYSNTALCFACQHSSKERRGKGRERNGFGEVKLLSSGRWTWEGRNHGVIIFFYPVMCQAKTIDGRTAWTMAVERNGNFDNACSVIICLAGMWLREEVFVSYKQLCAIPSHVHSCSHSHPQDRDYTHNLILLPCRDTMICWKSFGKQCEFKKCPTREKKIEFVYMVNLKTLKDVKEERDE